MQRDVDASSAQSTEMIRQSPLRDRDSERTVSVQRNILVACKGIKINNHFKSSFILTSETAKAFEELKIAFTTTPVLKHFNSELSTRVETNASGYVIDDILSQLHEGDNIQSHAIRTSKSRRRPDITLMTKSC